MPSRLFCCFGCNVNEERFLEDETAKCDSKEQKQLSTESDKRISTQSANRSSQFTDIADVTLKVIFEIRYHLFYVPIINVKDFLNKFDILLELETSITILFCSLNFLHARINELEC